MFDKLDGGFLPNLLENVACIRPSSETDEVILNRHRFSPDVDPFIGSGGDGYGCAALPPGAQVPFGTVRLSPDTLLDDVNVVWRHAGGYSYCDDQIQAFSHLHLVGAGVQDLGNLGVMPLLNATDERVRCFNPTADGRDLRFCNYGQRFRHADEVAGPGFYAVQLQDPTGAVIAANLTTTQHVGYHRYAFQYPSELSKSEYPRQLVFDLCHSIATRPGACENTSLSISPAENRMSGWIRFSGDFTARFNGFTLYFEVEFPEASIDPLRSGVFQQGVIQQGVFAGSGPELGALISFADDSPFVDARVSISFINQTQAQSHMHAQVGSSRFDQVFAQTQQVWKQNLNLVQVSGGSQNNRTKFFTALYHAFLAPTNWTEAGGVYLGFDNQVHQLPRGEHFYTDLSIWDIYRTEWPLLVFLQPGIATDTAQSLLRMAEQSEGILPRWPLMNGDTGSMEGEHAVVMLVDAILAGLNVDPKESLRRSAYTLRQSEGSAYLQTGYIPEQPTKTLSYVLDDFCVAQLAHQMGNQSVFESFSKSATFWENVWNPTVKFFCPRDANGKWLQCNDPITWKYRSAYPFDQYYREGDAWQYRWYLPSDIPGLMKKMGGEPKFTSDLDTFFEKSTTVHLENLLPNPWFWAGNEPDIQTPYLYQYGNHTDKTTKWVRHIQQEYYTLLASGLPGNDDYGTLSAWFVWSSLGIFPLHCDDQYVLGAPLFDEIMIQLSHSRTLKILAHNNTDGNVVTTFHFNGQALSVPFIGG
eukprot:CAMPEP_0174229876 /NCGR_PEP_ID=MMETSP0417-20130205/759_1 /TAXON_ID=242541 /ORGANISM="Mayorella sp, Strain BSH-02190019" /LENGTH=754 /DNA_ID=CAMNT_0015307475 /DNA_START=194 /DNA_END=2455 /DNA_ORIENTATION=+